VSVVIPTHNRRRRVCRAVESVLAQTRPPDEIVVVDDGSSDGTSEELARRFGDAIRLLDRPNGGCAAARNTGLAAARFGLVAFLDSDDIWHERKLELQLPTLDEPGVVISLTNWAWSDAPGQGAFESDGLRVPESPYLERVPLSLLVRPGRAVCLVQTGICRREALLRVGGFDGRLRFGEDTRMLLRMAFEGSFVLLPEVLLVRDEGRPGENLSLLDDPADQRERALAAVEILLEAYAAAGGAPVEVQRSLRQLVAYHLGLQARYAAEDGRWGLARRRAWESLAFGLSGRTALRCLAGLVYPRVMAVKKPRMAAGKAQAAGRSGAS
jgi:GT2 family glycosyltransferase